eukprot:TRINITY_DN66777_c1_g7_i1.p1 TRINITY_DN66777_c1_g7~~TRINITY_DN66777_c1_g7_i1.p1  ORF type:complete len:173 (+),score=21.78 TRINITY_DN66777_c1_g7_i1:57-575(+)
MSDLLEKLTTLLNEGSGSWEELPFFPASALDGSLWVCGSFDVTRVVKKHNITHVLGVAGDLGRKEANIEELPTENRPTYTQLEADDTPDFDMASLYPAAEEFISNARKAGGKVIVHCRVGTNRSVFLVLAYLVAHEGLDLLEAAAHIKKQRHGILANLGFRRQLVQFVEAQK